MRRWFFAGMAVGLLLRAGCVAEAATADYLVDVWDTENNLPSSTVTAIAQTPDGYLWVGTYNGLARFDGVRFVTFDPVNTPALSQTRVQGLFFDANGTLWINTFRGGLTSYRDGVFRNEWPDQADVRFAHHARGFVVQSGHVRHAIWRSTAARSGRTPSGLENLHAAAGFAADFSMRRQRWPALVFDARRTHPSVRRRRVQGIAAATAAWPAAISTRSWPTPPAGSGPARKMKSRRWDGSRFEAMTPTNGEADIQPQLLIPAKSGAMWVLDGDRFRKMAGREWVAEVAGWRGLLGCGFGPRDGHA